ncbi:MAG TPA: hypothetical protein VM884_04545 [Flavisolibacter sp.]|jgi:hypothetical protein|nr:hypothetical protein [Flavisolibacter sp.]
MENNQQQKGERNTSTTNEDNSFVNKQPGQQLPERGELAVKTNASEVQRTEHHSESSMPDAENETVGTP